MADRRLQAAILASIRNSVPDGGSGSDRLTPVCSGSMGPTGRAHLARMAERNAYSAPKRTGASPRALQTLKGTLAREGILPSNIQQFGGPNGPRPHTSASNRENFVSPQRGRGCPQLCAPSPGASAPANGMPTDLPHDAERALSRRLAKQGVKELAVPLGDGWMQRAGRGNFAVIDDLAAAKGGPVLQIESVEPNHFLLTFDQTPDAHITKSGHYRLEASIRCLQGLTVKDVPYAALVLNWNRARSTVTAPCFTAIVLAQSCWRIDQYADGGQVTLAEVRDSSLKAGGGFQKVEVEVHGDRISVTANRRTIFGSFTIPAPADPGGLSVPHSRRAAALVGPVGAAVFKSRAQLRNMQLSPLESADGNSAGSLGSYEARPAFTGGDPKLVELIEVRSHPHLMPAPISCLPPRQAPDRWAPWPLRSRPTAPPLPLPPTYRPPRPSCAQGEMLEARPNVAWDSIGGLADAKRLLNEAVVLPLLIPDYFAAAACRTAWKGVLLFGPPGTGKTLLARAVASLGKTAFFNISASSLVSKFHGESEKLARTLFALARHHAPSVVFFDEIDALVSTRGAAGEHEASRRLKSELLTQMDGLGSGTPSAVGADGLVMVLATSNKPWDLDEAMRRRLERRIYVPLPDEVSRREMLAIHLSGVRLDDALDLDELARLTDGYSGADMQLVCRDASMMPMRRAVQGKSPMEIVELQASGALEGEVSLDDFKQALQTTQPSTGGNEHAAFAKWNDEYGCKS